MFKFSIANIKKGEYVYRPFLPPALVFIILVVLTFTLGKFLLDQILASREAVGALKQENERLEEKKDKLAKISSQELEGFVTTAVLAVPGEDSTLPVLSTVRSLLFGKGLSISDLDVNLTGGSLGKTKTVEMEIAAQGAVMSAFEFIEDVKRAFPLMRISKADIKVSGESVFISFTIFSPWGSLPQELPKVDSSSPDITAADRELLNQLASLNKPLGGGQVVPAEPAGRSNPFEF